MRIIVWIRTNFCCCFPLSLVHVFVDLLDFFQSRHSPPSSDLGASVGLLALHFLFWLLFYSLFFHQWNWLFFFLLLLLLFPWIGRQIYRNPSVFPLQLGGRCSSILAVIFQSNCLLILLLEMRGGVGVSVGLFSDGYFIRSVYSPMKSLHSALPCSSLNREPDLPQPERDSFKTRR